MNETIENLQKNLRRIANTEISPLITYPPLFTTLILALALGAQRIPCNETGKDLLKALRNSGISDIAKKIAGIEPAMACETCCGGPGNFSHTINLPNPDGTITTYTYCTNCKTGGLSSCSSSDDEYRPQNNNNPTTKQKHSTLFHQNGNVIVADNQPAKDPVPLPNPKPKGPTRGAGTRYQEFKKDQRVYDNTFSGLSA